MFESLRTGHKIGSIASKWAAATSIDPGDNGQITNKAYEYIKNLNLNPEDAWLTALVNWMDGIPWDDSKKLIAQGILDFLDAYEGKIPLYAGAIINARDHAHAIFPKKQDNLTAALRAQLLHIVIFVPKHKYKDFFLVAYALFDEAYNLVTVEDKDFIELFSSTMGDISNAKNIYKNSYSLAFDEFIDDYLETDFEDLTETEIDIMAMGANLLTNPMEGMGISAYFMKSSGN